MSEPQQVVYRYSVAVGDTMQIPWFTTSKVVHVALLDNDSRVVHFWVAMPLSQSPAPFSREFYTRGTGFSFSAADVVEGCTVYEGPEGRLVWQLIRHEPGHTTN